MDFNEIVEPLIKIIESLVDPLLVIVGAIGIVYCVYLGIKLALAATPERRSNAVSHLITAVIAYVLIFVLIYLLKLYTPALKEFANGNTDELFNTQVDLNVPINAASDNIDQSRDLLDTTEAGAELNDAIDAGAEMLNEGAGVINNASTEDLKNVIDNPALDQVIEGTGIEGITDVLESDGLDQAADVIDSIDLTDITNNINLDSITDSIGEGLDNLTN